MMSRRHAVESQLGNDLSGISGRAHQAAVRAYMGAENDELLTRIADMRKRLSKITKMVREREQGR